MPSSTTRRTWRSAPRSWISCPVPIKKTDADPPDRDRPGLTPERLPGRRQPRHRAACGLQWLRDGVVAAPDDDAALRSTTSPPWPPTAAAGERRRDLHALARGRALPGRRPPRPGRLPQPVAAARPGPTWSGPSSEGVAYNSRWLARGASSASSAAARPDPDHRRRRRVRTSGARSTPTSWTGTIERVAEPCTPTCGAPPCSPGLRSARLRPTRCASLVPVDAALRARPANRAVYDRLFAEFPGLYRARRRCSPASTAPDSNPDGDPGGHRRCPSA